MGCVVPAPHVKKAVDSQRKPARVLLKDGADGRSSARHPVL